MRIRSLEIFSSPTLLDIESDDPPVVVLERLRRRAADWRESAVNERGRKMHILGWHLSEAEAGIAFGPAPGSSIVFRGKVLPTPMGSVIRGELRVDAATRAAPVILPIIWGALVAMAMVIVLFDPISGVASSWIRVLVANAIGLGALAVGRGIRWMNNYVRREVSLAILETLQAVARGQSSSKVSL